MTDKRQTPESVKARELLEIIKGTARPYSLQFSIETSLNHTRVAERLGDLMWLEGIKTGTLISSRPGLIFVSTSRRRQESRERSLIRKMMLLIEDEKVYDEAMEVLYGV